MTSGGPRGLGVTQNPNTATTTAAMQGLGAGATLDGGRVGDGVKSPLPGGADTILSQPPPLDTWEAGEKSDTPSPSPRYEALVSCLNPSCETVYTIHSKLR